MHSAVCDYADDTVLSSSSRSRQLRKTDVGLQSWSLVRRRFYELAVGGPAPIASEALKRIAALYVIETEARGRSPDERRALRQEKSRPLLDAMEPWLRT